jgi:hypothetical protein
MARWSNGFPKPGNQAVVRHAKCRLSGRATDGAAPASRVLGVQRFLQDGAGPTRVGFVKRFVARVNDAFLRDFSLDASKWFLGISSAWHVLGRQGSGPSYCSLVHKPTEEPYRRAGGLLLVRLHQHWRLGRSVNPILLKLRLLRDISALAVPTYASTIRR